MALNPVEQAFDIQNRTEKYLRTAGGELNSGTYLCKIMSVDAKRGAATVMADTPIGLLHIENVPIALPNITKEGGGIDRTLQRGSYALLHKFYDGTYVLGDVVNLPDENQNLRGKIPPAVSSKDNFMGDEMGTYLAMRNGNKIEMSGGGKTTMVMSEVDNSFFLMGDNATIIFQDNRINLSKKGIEIDVMDKKNPVLNKATVKITNGGKITIEGKAVEVKKQELVSILPPPAAARDGDKITVPLFSSTDVKHPDLNAIAASNISFFQTLAAMFVSPTGPCVFTPVPSPLKLEGLVTEGSKTVKIGD